MLGPLSSRGESGEHRTTSCARGLRQSTGKRAGVNILLNERERCAVCVRPCTSDEGAACIVYYVSVVPGPYPRPSFTFINYGCQFVTYGY
jgi:hypothetical protein